MIQVDRRVGDTARGIDVEHLEVLPARPRAETRLPWHGDGDLADAGQVELHREAGIEGEDAEASGDGRGDEAVHVREV